MKEAGAKLLRDAVQYYRRLWDQRHGDDVLTTALATWLGLSDEPSVSARAVEQSLILKKGAQRSYKDVAAAGFLVASTERTPEVDELFQRGVGWLVRRQTSFEGVPTGVTVDGVAMLGIALGTTSLTDAKLTHDVAGWAAGFLPTSIKFPGVPLWHKFLMGVTAPRLGIDVTVPYDPEIADVFVAMTATGVTPNAPQDLIDSAAAETLNLIRRAEATQTDIDRVGLALTAYEWIERRTSALVRPIGTVADACRILHQLERSLYRWTWEHDPRTGRKGAEARKWYIDSEYHLQNLLWVLLAPLFPDLKEEEFGASIGQLQPRLDLVIPSLALIIEAKFMYSRTSPQEMIEQIAADNSLYLPRRSVYRHIVPVIWDDAARTEEHSVLTQGLKELRGIRDVVILSRPAAMREERRLLRAVAKRRAT